MGATIIRKDNDELVIELRVPVSSNFLDFEKQVQDELSNAGRLLTERGLEDFDADGSPIIIGNTKYTAKQKPVEKKYETPFGAVKVERYAYQSSAGGTTHIPLEHNARIIGNSTPRFAKLVSSKYSHNNAATVQQDLAETLHRKISRCYIQDISSLVAAGIEAKSSLWDSAGDEPLAFDVASIGIGLDGVCMLFCDDGYRQAMVGTIAFYDAAGERLHTTYVAAAPEHGKGIFLQRMDEEIARVKKRYSHARYVGISDGAGDFRPWLEKHTTTRVLDFWHLTEYLAEVAKVMFARKAQREQWMDARCHSLKHEHGAAKAILAEIEKAAGKEGLSKPKSETLDTTIVYMTNNLDRTNYASYRKSHLPIGSGVTEAACKSVVKQRMCGSGMKWKFSGAQSVLSLRAKRLTKGAWEAFWTKIGQIGL
jgi:hypothetical protein